MDAGHVTAIGAFSRAAPVSAHLLGRVSYAMGVPLWKHTHRDELRARSSRSDHTAVEGPSDGRPIVKTKGNQPHE